MIVKVLVFVTSDLPNLGKVTSTGFVAGLICKIVNLIVS